MWSDYVNEEFWGDFRCCVSGVILGKIGVILERFLCNFWVIFMKIFYAIFKIWDDVRLEQMPAK